jgi:replicative DNA helicase
VVHIAELFQHDLPHAELTGVSMGFAAVDRVTGGLGAGQVLLVGTPPGQGKSTYAAQLAASAALTDRSVEMYCPRESRRAAAARILASTARAPYDSLLRARSLPREERARAQALRERLAATRLHVYAEQPLDLEQSRGPHVLVVDDVHSGGEQTRTQLQELSRSGSAVIATLPVDLLVRGTVAREAEVDRLWADLCDFAMAFVWPGADAPDRWGESDLFLLKNRHGPLLDEVVVFQGWCARFIDLAGAPPARSGM